MTESHARKLEILRSTVSTNLTEDLERDRRRFISDSFSFLKAAWEIDAVMYSRLAKVGSVPVGTQIEIYISGVPDKDMPIVTNSERIVEIQFNPKTDVESETSIRVQFAIPANTDITDPHALQEVADPIMAIVAEESRFDDWSYYLVTPYSTDPMVIPDVQGGNDTGAFLAYELIDTEVDDENNELHRESAWIARLRQKLAGDLVPMRKLIKVDDAFTDEPL